MSGGHPSRFRRQHTDRFSVTKPTVIIVEPYGANSGGHHPRALQEAASAFEAIDWDTHAARPDGTLRTRAILLACRSLAGVARAAGRISRLLHATGVEDKTRRLSRTMRAIRKELPYLAGAARVARSAPPGTPTFVLLTTSYMRPLWLKSSICRHVPLVEIVFEPVTTTERYRSRFFAAAATTPLVEQSIRLHTRTLTVDCLGHFPVQAPVVVSPSDIRHVLVATVAQLDQRGPWVLYFGQLHGKKDTVTVIRSAPELDQHSSIYIVGDPAYEGRHLPDELQAILSNHPAIRCLFDRVTDSERLWLFSRASGILIAQRPSVASMSGSLPDALAFNKPIIATAGTATGNAVADLGAGALYTSGDPRSLAAAIGSALRLPPVLALDPAVLADHGLMGPRDEALSIPVDEKFSSGLILTS